MTTTLDPSPLDFERCYRALAARDTRFDGQFVTTVLTTGIYCRPSCPARTPKADNVRFELTAAAAAARGFRACRRCLPDATPGSPLWNVRSDLAARAMRLIADGVVDRDGVGGLAAALGYTERHISRVLVAELGAGTVALARTHRATAARLLLNSTDMSIGDVAFAAGFSSIRQFNDTIRELYDTTPSALRASGGRAGPSSTGDSITLRLPFRPPYDSAWTLYGLAAHAVDGLELWDGSTFERTLRLPHRPASVRISLGPDHVVTTFEHLDMRDLGAAVNRVRRLLDLDADPVAVDDALGRDPILRPLVDAHPGIRIPGSVDGVETLIRVMMGQQISVKAARTHIARLVAELGEPTGWPSVGGRPNVLFPTAEAIAEHGPAVLTGPARAIRSITAAAACGERMELHAGVDASNLRADLLRLSGVGDWTADQVVMRVTGDPDILTRRDLVIDRALADLGAGPTDTGSWRPWRSYASMHLWRQQLAHRVDDVVAP
ncbi:helix-turn-helix domain-containing protein [Gordonia sp. HY002]|uniref:AlkA N-terminal domain-containing protein n=1 Tax=Gordonia zhenghanii TaxID=2911516 RepID=UPI001EEFC0D5|nr:AlkA N-terminal domain-containing protein [Gordonia zhenghanii]MCF8571548.1 helix-turn-helix domain-containing protein [Gordonia zhenghanii]MCF8605769.1 helix-turn-helix domain-containing protein [Gordonia zhenghanii]